MFLILFAIWLIFNGKITLEILLVGAAVSAALTLMWKALFHTQNGIIFPWSPHMGAYLKYAAGLLLEIIRSNLSVMRVVLHPGQEVKPQMITFCHGLKNPNHRVLLANSITLTPGTITVGLRENAICVHALDASYLEGIEHCDMLEQLKKIEEEDSRE